MHSFWSMCLANIKVLLFTLLNNLEFNRVKCYNCGRNDFNGGVAMKKKNSTAVCGRHFLVEMLGCCVFVINNRSALQEAMESAALASRMTIVESVFHNFSPFGISGVVVIAESHIAIHTWPEKGFAAVDVFTCGNEGEPKKAVEFLTRVFKARETHLMEIKRGLHAPKIIRRKTETHPPG